MIIITLRRSRIYAKRDLIAAHLLQHIQDFVDAFQQSVVGFHHGVRLLVHTRHSVRGERVPRLIYVVVLENLRRFILSLD